MNRIILASRDIDDLSVPIYPDKVEERRNAKFVGEFCLRDRFGWVNDPVQLYWQETPPVVGYSNYFALFIRDGEVFITSGQTVADEPITAIRCGEEVIWSRFRHDLRGSADGKAAIDGGRDYTKITGTPDEILTLRIVGPNLVVDDAIDRG